MQKNILNKKLYYRKVETLFDPVAAGIGEAWWPTKEDFAALWPELGKRQKAIVKAAIISKNIGEVQEETGYAASTIVTTLKEDAVVAKAIIIAKMCNLESDTAKSIYLETLLKNAYSRQFHYEEVQRIIKTDRDHLREMAEQLDITGDGKRRILKEIAAYGMQLKQVEPAQHDSDTGVETKPPVLALADPRMAYNAVQELNRMDHEYGQDDKATSSIEGQAERIKRLRLSMDRVATEQAKVVGGIARRVADREIRDIEDV